MENQTVKWHNYYRELKTYHNQAIIVDEDDPTLGKWGERKVVCGENGFWYEDYEQ